MTKTGPPQLAPPLKIGDFIPGKPVPDDILARVLLHEPKLTAKNWHTLNYRDWMDCLLGYVDCPGGAGDKSVHRQVLDRYRRKGFTNRKPPSRRSVSFMLSCGCPHLGLAPIPMIVQHNPHITLLAQEQIEDLGTQEAIRRVFKRDTSVSQLERPTMDGPSAGAGATKEQETSAPDLNMDIVPLARRPQQQSTDTLGDDIDIPMSLVNTSRDGAAMALVEKCQRAAAGEASREHLNVQAGLEASLQTNEMLLTYIDELKEAIAIQGGFALPPEGTIGISTLEKVAFMLDTLSKAELRLVDASQKMRGERGIDNQNQTAMAVGLLIANADGSSIRTFLQTRQFGALQESTGSSQGAQAPVSSQSASDIIDVEVEELPVDADPSTETGEEPKRVLPVDMAGRT